MKRGTFIFLFVILLLLLFYTEFTPANSPPETYLTSETLTQEACSQGQEQKSTLTDNIGITFNHCVSIVDSFAQGTYVLDSYLELYDGVTHCPEGGVEKTILQTN
ncbi:MAG: hypothetical protein ABIH92_00870, partial [Nanoarchaeota archaeon]